MLTLQQSQELRAVVVAQMVGRSLPIPEAHGSNPVIGKIYIKHFTVNCIEKTKIKKKRLRMAHFFKKELRPVKRNGYLYH